MPNDLIAFEKRIQQLEQDQSMLNAGISNAASLSLKDQLIMKYHNAVLTELKRILSDRNIVQSTMINAIEKFLKDNWNKIKGTALTYTALPTHPVTELLCDIAVEIAKHNQNQVAPIQILIPTACIEDQNADIAESKKLQNSELKTILKTHILGCRGDYLIPLNLITRWSYNIDLKKIGNPYYDFEKHSAECAYLNEDELSRLQQHSFIAQTLFNIREEYQQLSRDSDHLLGQLNTLIRLMLFNSSHGGIGTAEIAAPGGNVAILHFFNFYEKLSEEDKAKIPEPIKKELIILCDYTLPEKDRTHKNMPTIGSCLGTRQAELKKAMQGHEPPLAAITISRENRSQLIEQKITDFKENIAELKKQLQENQYQGQDPLPITKKILADMGVNFEITHLDELALFNHLTPIEITEICSIKGAPEQIVTVIHNIENLVIHIINSSRERLQALLIGIQTPLLNKLIKTPQDLSATLISLEPNKTTTVCYALKDHLPTIIKTVENLNQVLYFLSSEQRTVVYEACKDQLPNIIYTATDFKNALHLLSSEQCTAVCRALKDQLPNIIHTATDFKNALCFLSSEQCRAVCEALKNVLPGIIKTATDFKNALCYFSPEQCTAVYEALKDQLLKIIHTADDFYKVLFFLSPEQCTAVCKALKDQLLKIIHTAANFNDGFCLLSPEKRTAVYEVFKDQLPDIIYTVTDFKNVLYSLSPEQCTAVCRALKDRLLNIIHTAANFNDVLCFFLPEQCTAICEAFKDQLFKIIHTAADFNGVLHSLSPEQYVMTRQFIEKTAIRNFLAHLDIRNNVFWKNQTVDSITIQKILDHANGQHATSRFYGLLGHSHTGDNTKKMLKLLDVDVSKAQVEDVTVALLKLNSFPEQRPDYLAFTLNNKFIHT